MNRTLSNADLQLINLFCSNTGANAKDTVLTDEAVVFVVGKGDLGKAIGKNGSNIARLRRVFGRGVEVVEEAPDLPSFLANAFKPAQLLQVREENREGKRVATVSVAAEERGKAIGKGGSRIKRARLLASRHFGVDDIRII